MAVLSFLTYLSFENREKYGVYQGLRLSLSEILKRKGIITSLLLVGWLLNVVGLVMFFAGVLISMPISVFMLAYAYHDLFGTLSNGKKND